MGETCKQLGGFNENGNKTTIYTQNQKISVEISGAHNEEWRLGYFDTHRILRMQDVQWKTVMN